MIEVDCDGEGPTDEAYACALIRAAGAAPGRSWLPPPARQRPTPPQASRGSSGLDRRLAGHNRSARGGRLILVLRDLDALACPAGLKDQLLTDFIRSSVSERLVLRIAVRESEAWLLADTVGLAAKLGLPQSAFPEAPECLDDPKRVFLDLLATTTSRPLRRELGIASLGDRVAWQQAAAWVAEHARTDWDVHRAVRSGRAPSLTRALKALRRAVLASRHGG